jgi:hypothetical protein
MTVLSLLFALLLSSGRVVLLFVLALLFLLHGLLLVAGFGNGLVVVVHLQVFVLLHAEVELERVGDDLVDNVPEYLVVLLQLLLVLLDVVRFKQVEKTLRLHGLAYYSLLACLLVLLLLLYLLQGQVLPLLPLYLAAYRRLGLLVKHYKLLGKHLIFDELVVLEIKVDCEVVSALLVFHIDILELRQQRLVGGLDFALDHHVVLQGFEPVPLDLGSPDVVFENFHFVLRQVLAYVF